MWEKRKNEQTTCLLIATVTVIYMQNLETIHPLFLTTEKIGYRKKRKVTHSPSVLAMSTKYFLKIHLAISEERLTKNLG